MSLDDGANSNKQVLILLGYPLPTQGLALAVLVKQTITKWSHGHRRNSDFSSQEIVSDWQIKKHPNGLRAQEIPLQGLVKHNTLLYGRGVIDEWATTDT